MNTLISPGKSFPLGATAAPSGVNFSVFSKGSTAVRLLLFNQADDAYPSRTITLDPVTNRSRHYWHVFVPGIGVGQIYVYRVDGSFLPDHLLPFHHQNSFLLPYS